jgi:hypothetical protein
VRNFDRGAALALAGAAAVAGSLVIGSPAMAESTPIGVCGGGSYHEIDRHDLGQATIYLLYNGSTNCVVTWKDSPNSTRVQADLQRVGGEPEIDAGEYSTYAGPVKVKAAGVCIRWGGAYGKEYWNSGWSHCG